MKITIATGPIFPVPAVRGGAVQRLWDGLAHEFVQRGHEVTIFAREFPGQAKEETVDGIRYVRRGGYAQSTSIKRDLVQCLIYALKTARHVPSGDVVVTNDFWMPAVLPRLKPSAGKVVPCLQRFPKKQGWLYGKCAALAAVSQAVADAVRTQSPSVGSRVAVVPNAVDDVFLKPLAPKNVQDKLRILYVGRIHPEKGVALLANALRLLAARDQKTKRPKDEETKGPQMCESPKVASPRSEGEETKRLSGEGAGWEFVLVGPVAQSEGGGGEAFAAELKRQVEGLPVRFEAPVFDPEALAKIYDRADVFVYPSVAEMGESFGIAPLEAMARGLVPVVSDLAVFRQYIEPGVNGIVFDHRPATAPAQLAAAIDSLLQDAARRKAMAAKARQTAETYSLSATADRYLSLFAKITEEPR